MEWYKAHAAAAVAAPGTSIDEQVAALEKAEKEGKTEQGARSRERESGTRCSVRRLRYASRISSDLRRSCNGA